MKTILLFLPILFVGCVTLSGPAEGEEGYEDPAVVLIETAKPFVDAVTPFMSEKHAAILGAIFGLGAGLVRANRNRKVAKKVIAAIEDAKDGTDVINFSDPSVVSRLNSQMGPKGRAIVDEVQGKATTKLF